jgi:U3 small nucleolar RNA-associated protein 14
MQISKRTLGKRDKLLTKVQGEHASKVMARTDAKKMNVLISQRRVKTASKYKVGEIPHPFTTREEYERSLQMPLGEEWNASHIVQKNTAPEIKLRAGRILEPVKLSKKRSAPATALSEPAIKKGKKAKK